MKNFFVLMAVLSAMNASAKTTYIPAYTSYAHIIVRGDTVMATANKLRSMELLSPDGTYRITVQHEDLTQERVKAIKRVKRAMGWAMASAILGNVSAAFSDNSLQYSIGKSNASVANELAALYAGKAMAAQILGVEVWLENLTDDELIVSDCERGLTWYVQPRNALLLTTNNPDMVVLRVSDLLNKNVSFATIAAGSAVDKVELKHEDDDCWVIVAYERRPDGTLNPLGGFKYINKHDFSQRLINYRQFQDFLKER